MNPRTLLALLAVLTYSTGCQFVARDAPGSSTDDRGDTTSGDTDRCDNLCGDAYGGDASGGDVYGGDAYGGDAASTTAARIEIVAPMYAAVGDAVTASLRALDAVGGHVPDFSGNVTLLVTGSATGQGLVAISSGTGNASISDSVAETVTLSMADSAGLGIDVSHTTTITFLAATVDSLALTLSSGPHRVGVPIDITVTAHSHEGELNPNYRGTIRFSSSDPDTRHQVPPDYTFTASDGGSHLFPGGLVFFTTGVQTVYVNDTDGSAASAARTTTIEIGPPTALELEGSSHVRASICSAAFAVSTLDAGGNRAPVEADTVVTLSSSGAAQFWDEPTCLSAPAENLTFQEPSSRETFSFIEPNPGELDIEATSPGLTGASLAVTVVAQQAPATLGLYVARDFDNDGLPDAIGTDERVAVWPDLSGNQHDADQATAAHQPLRTVVDGNIVLQLDGTDDYMDSGDLADAISWIDEETDGITIVVVRRVSRRQSAAFCSLFGPTVADSVLVFGVDGQGRALLGMSGGKELTSAAPVTPDLAVQAVSIDAVTGRARVYVNAEQVIHDAVPVPLQFFTVWRFTIGAAWKDGGGATEWESTGHLAGDLLHIVVLDQALSGSEIHVLTNMLRTTYNF
jgi:hypothetical protein